MGSKWAVSGERHFQAGEQLQDLQTSTISAVRALGWASATLGMPAPPIYVDPKLDCALEFIATVPPATRIGTQFLAGQNTLTVETTGGTGGGFLFGLDYIKLVPAP